MVNPLKHHFKVFLTLKYPWTLSAETLIHYFPQHSATGTHNTFQCLQQQQHSTGNHSPISKSWLLQRWTKPRQTGLFILVPTEPPMKRAHSKSEEKQEQLSFAVCLKRDMSSSESTLLTLGRDIEQTGFFLIFFHSVCQWVKSSTQDFVNKGVNASGGDSMHLRLWLLWSQDFPQPSQLWHFVLSVAHSSRTFRLCSWQLCLVCITPWHACYGRFTRRSTTVYFKPSPVPPVSLMAWQHS